MNRKRKKQAAEIATFAGIESALEEKIERIDRISDPIEQLLQYRALREAGEIKFDKTKVLPWDADRKAEWKYTKSMGRGFFTGLFGGIALGIALTSTAVLTGLGGFVAAWMGLWAAGAAVGHVVGKKRRKAMLGSPEDKHATQMSHMANHVDFGIEQSVVTFNYLTGNFQNKNCMDRLAKSSHFDEIKKAFPEIATEFNRQAKINRTVSDRQEKIAAQQKDFLARQEAFMAQVRPSTKPSAL